MAYDAKPTQDDVILNAWQERDRTNVALYLREGADGQGDEVMNVWDEAAVELFEDGFLKAGEVKSRDSKLLETAFDYASTHGLGALGGFEARLSKLVAAAEAGLKDAYEALDKSEPALDDEEPEERYERLANKAVEKVMAEGFGWVSESRFEDVEAHLQDEIGGLGLEPGAQAPAP